jgi:hypothetical protein
MSSSVPVSVRSLKTFFGFGNDEFEFDVEGFDVGAFDVEVDEFDDNGNVATSFRSTFLMLRGISS